MVVKISLPFNHNYQNLALRRTHTYEQTFHFILNVGANTRTHTHNYNHVHTNTYRPNHSSIHLPTDSRTYARAHAHTHRRYSHTHSPTQDTPSIFEYIQPYTHSHPPILSHFYCAFTSIYPNPSPTNPTHTPTHAIFSSFVL